jgi:hypothetical protein
MWAILYIIFLRSPRATQCICYIVQLVSVFLRRRSFSAALEARCAPLPSIPNRKWICDSTMPPSEDQRCENRLAPNPGYRTTPCSSVVQSCKGAYMFLSSLLPLDWRQGTVLQMAELFNRCCQYCTLSILIHPHMWMVIIVWVFTVVSEKRTVLPHGMNS